MKGSVASGRQLDCIFRAAGTQSARPFRNESRRRIYCALSVRQALLRALRYKTNIQARPALSKSPCISSIRSGRLFPPPSDAPTNAKNPLSIYAPIGAHPFPICCNDGVCPLNTKYGIHRRERMAYSRRQTHFPRDASPLHRKRSKSRRAPRDAYSYIRQRKFQNRFRFYRLSKTAYRRSAIPRRQDCRLYTARFGGEAK